MLLKHQLVEMLTLNILILLLWYRREVVVRESPCHLQKLVKFHDFIAQFYVCLLLCVCVCVKRSRSRICLKWMDRVSVIFSFFNFNFCQTLFYRTPFSEKLLQLVVAGNVFCKLYCLKRETNYIAENKTATCCRWKMIL